MNPRDRARELRRTAPEAEKRLWWHLRNRLPLEGTYFRRQVPLGPYFADFCCLKLRIVVELDGDQHGDPDAQAFDARRTAFLESQSFVVLRFWNHQVFNEMDGVLEMIASVIAKREGAGLGPSPPAPLHKGEG